MIMSSKSTSKRHLKDGVYVPTPAFFLPNEELDLETTGQHAERLAIAGVSGLVIHGSNGEAVHLSREEREKIIAAVRTTLDGTGFGGFPLIAGCSAQSTRESIRLCQDAAAAGANFAILLPPSYYSTILDLEKIEQYFFDVADASPLPIVIYNYPGAASGLDLSSDTIIRLARHPNIVGVKLTCGNVGKLVRIVKAIRSESYSRFFVAGGSADFILQGLVVGSHGTIAGTANVVPRTCVRLCEHFRAGRLQEAQRLQDLLANADWAAIQTGFAGVKAALQLFYGYGGAPRQPCTLPSEVELEMIKRNFEEVIKMEKTL